MNETLDHLLDATRVRDDTFAFHVPDGWGQGRATFGGLVLGAMVRAMKTVAGDADRRMRTLSAELVGAVVAGPAEITVRALRRGNAITALSAELAQSGEVMTHATAVFGAPRAFTERWRRLPERVRAPWREAQSMDTNAAFAPQFTQHFDFRPLDTLPFTGGEAVTSGWIRPRRPGASRDESFVTAVADAWWLGAFVPLQGVRPAATLTFALDLHDTLDGLDPDAPLFHRGEALALTDGYASEVRELWGEDGRLVAINRQLVAIIK